MTRILLVAPSFPPLVGGIASYLYARCSGAAEQVIVLAPAADGAREWDNQAHCRVYRFPRFLHRWFGLRQLEQLAWGMILVPYLHWRYRFDWIEYGQALPWGIIALVMRIVGVPYWVWTYGDDVLRPMAFPVIRSLLGLILRKARAVGTDSRYTAGLVQSAGVSVDHIHVLCPPVDWERSRKASLETQQAKRQLKLEGYRIILTVASLAKRKGVDWVIRALPRVLRKVPDALYMVVGDGPMRAEWEALAAQIAVDQRVIFAGRVTDDYLAICYSACDVFILVSHTDDVEKSVEGFGIVYLEAGSFGKAVISGNQGGVLDAVEPGVSGIAVDPLDVEAISEALCKILTNPTLADQLGKKGRERAMRSTDWKVIFEAMQRT